MSLAPLSERVAPPAELPEPEARDGVVWRAATNDDLDAILDVHAAMADVDHPSWAETRDELRNDLEQAWIDLALDSRIAFAGDRPVAFGLVSCPRAGETAVRSLITGGVVPAFRGRGLGRELLAWQIARATQQLAEVPLELPGWILGEANEGSDRIGLFERAGMPARRWFFALERDLAEPIPDLAVPEGLRFAPSTPDRWEQMRETTTAAFRDHWGSRPSSEAEWARIMQQSSSRHDLSVLAIDAADRVVGLLTTLVIPEDFERQGYPSTYIQLIGVLREWRRRGVAPALIATALRAARDAGFARTTLHVDAENPTGALRLYEGMGFTPIERSQAHILER